MQNNRFCGCGCALLLSLVAPLAGTAQDSTVVLPEARVEAYRYDRPLLEVAAPVSVVGAEQLNRFSPASAVPVLNTVPGVRMEERSPGSYRLSIRGSLLRSPFGVRNVKVYWNAMPLTDAGGNTYLNLLDLSAIGTVEIIKGPGGSLYGAGTGGVLSIRTPPAETGIAVSPLVGSYGLRRVGVEGAIRTPDYSARVDFAHQQSDGYRDHTALRRNFAHTTWQVPVGTSTLIQPSFFYSAVQYQTPGGLTAEEYRANPRQARPSTMFTRGAVEQNASVDNRTGYAGLVVDHDWSRAFTSRLAVYGSFTDFRNFAIANYEHREETNTGFRSENQFSWEGVVAGKLVFGGEYQYLLSPIDVFSNDFGVTGQFLIGDETRSRQAIAFVQADLSWQKWMLTLGASESFITYRFRRNAPSPERAARAFSGVFSPRVAVLNKLTDRWSVHASVSAGFSPPTLAELRPSTNTFSRTLDAERGVNYELGVRGGSKAVHVDVTSYWFQLQEAIVQQRDETGAEYFVNAGNTRQLGIEAYVRWKVAGPVSLWATATLNNYRFVDYSKDGASLDGNELTGVPSHVLGGGVDVGGQKGIYGSVSAIGTGRIPLNDANTEYADAYALVALRCGYRFSWQQRTGLEVFIGAENLLDEVYSLGNDLNAARGRYYNAAAPRQFFAGLRYQLSRTDGQE